MADETVSLPSNSTPETSRPVLDRTSLAKDVVIRTMASDLENLGRSGGLPPRRVFGSGLAAEPVSDAPSRVLLDEAVLGSKKNDMTIWLIVGAALAGFLTLVGYFIYSVLTGT